MRINYILFKCFFLFISLDPGKSLGPSGTFEFWDWNEDGRIDVKDVSIPDLSSSQLPMFSNSHLHFNIILSSIRGHVFLLADSKLDKILQFPRYEYNRCI